MDRFRPSSVPPSVLPIRSYGSQWGSRIWTICVKIWPSHWSTSEGFAYERSLLSCSLPQAIAGFGGYFVVQPLEPGIVNVFRCDLGEKVRIVDVLSDHLLDCATVFRVGLHDQNHFSLFHYLLFFTVCAGDWKPIGANRQPLFQQCATDLAGLVSSIECDIIDSHKKNGAVGIATLSAHQTARRN